MGAEQAAVVPNALALGFVDRVHEHATTGQFNRLAVHLARRGVAEYLDDLATDQQLGRLASNVERAGVVSSLGKGAARAAWSTYMQVVDGITFADAKADPEGPPKHTRLIVRFADYGSRVRFHYLSELLYAGITPIRGYTMPHIRTDGPRTLRISNFSHPDIANPGRVGTVLFRQEYAHLGPNLRLVLQHTIDEILTSGVVRVLPTELVARLAHQKHELGGGTLLTSGQLSRIGTAVRRALHGTEPLAMQRPRGNRPAIEEGTRFFARKTTPTRSMPVSGATVGQVLTGQVLDQIDALRAPYDRRDPVAIVAGLWDILVGLGVKEGVVSAVRATGTLSVSSVRALVGMRKDRRLLRKMAKNDPSS